MTALILDRIEIEDSGANPGRLAVAIHRQLGARPGPVPVHEIARALDIFEIREEYLDNCEAALITRPERSYGSILLNLHSSPQRRRYSVGHELLHFLNAWHEPTVAQGFQCSRQDMRESKKSANDRHLRQEAEANEFAIELLAPSSRVRPYVETPADLKHALAMARDLDISREAAARRFVALHEEPLAVVFVNNGLLRYAEPGAEFPGLSIAKAQPVPFLPTRIGAGTLSEMEEIDAVDWLQRPDSACLSAQIFRQREGYATVLLRAELNDADDSELEDTYQRFTRT